MSRVATLDTLIEDTLELSGRAGTTTPDRATRAINRATVWAWRSMCKAWEGFAIRETELLSPVGPLQDAVSIQAGAGGQPTPQGKATLPIQRGVFKVRGVYRPLAQGGAPDEFRYPAEFMPREVYYDRVAPLLDQNNVVTRPGYYWYDQREDGAVDQLIFRPTFEDSVNAELIRLVYQETAPDLVLLTDTLEVLSNAEDAITHRAGYYLLLAQDGQKAVRLELAADKHIQDSVLAYTGERDQASTRSVSRYRRSSAGRAWRRFGGSGGYG